MSRVARLLGRRRERERKVGRGVLVLGLHQGQSDLLILRNLYANENELRALDGQYRPWLAKTVCWRGGVDARTRAAGLRYLHRA